MIENYLTVLDSLLLREGGQPVCVPLRPGYGKTTWMINTAKQRIADDLANAGMVICVEKVETARRIAEEIGTFELVVNGDSQTRHAAYVMESAFTSRHCRRHFEYYRRGACRGCRDRNMCPIPIKYQLQEAYPVVVITHKRLAQEGKTLDRYAYWLDGTGNSYSRRLLIIDEKPPFVHMGSFGLADISRFEEQLENIKEYIFDYPQLLYELDQCKRVLNNREGKVAPINLDYQFYFKSIWNTNYTGPNPEIIDNIELLIRRGGYKSDFLNAIIVSEKNEFVFDGYNTIILDGTGEIDFEYSWNNIEVAQIPQETEPYEALTIHLNEEQYYRRKLADQSHLAALANAAKVVCEDKLTLFLCHKKFKPAFQELLNSEIEAGRIFVNHFGAVKGSNDYLHCTAIFFAGLNNKGDSYYLAKQQALDKLPDDISTNTLGRARHFNDEFLELLRASDLLIDLIQDIYRTALRVKDDKRLIQVYISTCDKILVGLLSDYFKGCRIENWDLKGSPNWVKVIEEIFSSLEVGDTVQKRELKAKAKLSDVQMKRLSKRTRFQNLMRKYKMTYTRFVGHTGVR